MALRIISVGSLSMKPLAALEEEYVKRLRSHLKIGFVEIAPAASSNSGTAKVMEDEGAKLLRELRPGEYVCALDERGESCDSAAFAKLLERQLAGGNVAFLIGGAYGLSDTVRSRANKLLSLSSMTFTYQWARVLLVEQIYRAHCTLRGVDYQK